MKSKYALLVFGFALALIAVNLTLILAENVSTESVANLPLFIGFYEGQDVVYIITEISVDNSSVAIHVPSLSNASEDLTAEVYQFTNGHKDQKSVFDTVPGDDGYSPLWEVYKVTWQQSETPTILRSIEEIEMAEEEGKLVIQETDKIVNCPILIWPEGQHPMLPA